MSERERYQEYLCSREWATLKEAVHARAGGTCERCGQSPGHAVHHLTYARKYHEQLADLQLLCEPCHDFTHGKSDYDPRIFDCNFHHTENPLRCPRCKGDNLHHIDVIVSDCIADGSSTTRVTAVGPDNSLSSKLISAKIPHGVAISFWCENCDQYSLLTITQRKGETELGWERQDKNKPKR